MKKRISACLLAITLCLSLFSVAAFASDSTADSGNVENAYVYDDATRTMHVKGWLNQELSDTVCAQITNAVPGAQVVEFWANPEETALTNVFYAESAAKLAPAEDVIVGNHLFEFSVRYMPVQIEDDNGQLVNFQDEDYLSWIAVREESDGPVTLSDGEYQIEVMASISPADGSGMNAAGYSSITTFYLVVGVDDLGEGDVPSASASPFTDVAGDAYYANAVAWAVEQGITSGTSATTFSPDDTCTRAQIISFLWRAAGSPEPADINGFSDVKTDAYYAKASAWALENGMASGDVFSPDSPCTREMAVEFMWKHAGSPIAETTASFTDVSSDAVNWAVEHGVTSGTSATTFSPDDTCTRAQIVSFLYRAFAE